MLKTQPGFRCAQSGLQATAFYVVPQSRRTRLLGELLEHCAQRTGRTHALWKRQAQGRAIELQLEPFRVAADAAPGTVGGTEESGGVEPASVSVVGIHMRQDVGLRGGKLSRVLDRRENVLRLEVDDAAETGNQVRALER